MAGEEFAKYFKPAEFKCKCCGKVVIDGKLVERLDALRKMLNKPIYINSGYRCAKHNLAVKGSPTSQHLLGKAADIRAIGITPKSFATMAEKIGFDGIGIYNWGIHVDMRGYKARWNG